MDFTTRGAQSHPSAAAESGVGTPASGSSKNKLKNRDSNKVMRVLSVAFLFCLVVLVAAMLALLGFGGTSESKYLTKSDFQAVDISVGGANSSDQIYFGHITTLNSSYFVLNHVYYIPATQNSSSITLEPLVCQIDMPFDQMVVNRNSVNWWENLQSGSKVVQTITNYEKQNPKGANCPTQSNSSTNSNTQSNSSSSSSTNTGSSGSNSSTSTTPTTTTTTH